MLINKQHKCQGRAGEKTLKIFPMLKLLNVLDGLVSNGGCSNSSLSVCHHTDHMHPCYVHPKRGLWTSLLDSSFCRYETYTAR